MEFEPLALQGAFLIHLEPKCDARGSFTRLFDAELFARRELATEYPQHNLSRNPAKGTLRGLHYQRSPHAEIKLVRCIRGRIYDVIVDVRESSATYLQHVGVELRADTPAMLYVPEGFAHGFLTLEPDSEVHYLVSHPYTPSAEGGLRWDDPKLHIQWPERVEVVSERDMAHNLL